MPEKREFVTLLPKQGAAYLWHRCLNWGWQQTLLKQLFLASFDSSTAVSVMNSKWYECMKCAIAIEMSAEAVAFLNFGSSPFILKEGEEKAQHHKSTKGMIECRNLKPDDIGGMEADDLASLGEESNAETVFKSTEDGEEYEDYDMEDDEISKISDNEEFDGEQESDDESTKAPQEESDDKEMGTASDNDHDSTESTKASCKDLDNLVRGGWKVRGDAKYAQRLEALYEEKAKAEEAMNQCLHEIEAKFEERMAKAMVQLKMKEQLLADALANTCKGKSPGPGVAGGSPKEGEDLPKDSAGNALANIK